VNLLDGWIAVSTTAILPAQADDSTPQQHHTPHHY